MVFYSPLSHTSCSPEWIKLHFILLDSHFYSVQNMCLCFTILPKVINLSTVSVQRVLTGMQSESKVLTVCSVTSSALCIWEPRPRCGGKEVSACLFAQIFTSGRLLVIDSLQGNLRSHTPLPNYMAISGPPQLGHPPTAPLELQCGRQVNHNILTSDLSFRQRGQCTCGELGHPPGAQCPEQGAGGGPPRVRLQDAAWPCGWALLGAHQMLSPHHLPKLQSCRSEPLTHCGDCESITTNPLKPSLREVGLCNLLLRSREKWPGVTLETRSHKGLHT